MKNWKAGTLIRNKLHDNISKVLFDTSFINENIWEIWEPKENEWCWFFEDLENFPLGFVLDKFSRKDKYNNYVTQCSGESFEYCLPFEGELPV